MKPLLRRLLGVGVLTVLALGAVRAGCRAVPEEETAVREGADSGADRTEEPRRRDRLDRQQQVIFWAVRQRLALVADVSAGRLTLLETAAGFRAIQQVKQKVLQPVPLPFPGRSEEERLCRQVIDYLEQALHDQPNRAEVVGRLEAELRRHLRGGGTLCLPEPPPLCPPPEP